MGKTFPKQPNSHQANAGKLTERQQRFIDEYIVSLNATQAAIKAGYTARNAATAGCQNLTHPKISARIAALQAERTARTQVDADWVLTRLLGELTAKVADLYAEDGSLLHPRDWPDVWQHGLVTHIQTTQLYGPPDPKTGKPTVIGQLKDVTFADRVKRIELFGRHINIQAFKEKVAVGVDAPLRALFDQISGQSVRPQAENRVIEHLPNEGEA